MSDMVPLRLAAIICADVVGYSRLMGQDSARTLTALRGLRSETLAPMVADHRGQVVKSMGDGWLITFTSVVDAVGCAIRLQQDLASNPTIKLRIGLHLGDVTIEDEDVFGDGVNIAARLQDIADPGGIVISDLAWRSIDRKLAATFDDLGVHRLKNIAEPVGLHGRGTTSITTQAKAPPSSGQFSIAVMPFHNLSNEPEQEYFVDGISEDIIAELSKIPELLVIARNSSFAYKGKAVPVQEVCGSLGVQYVLEGSVRKSGLRLRIGAQLVDGASGGQLWAERYDRRLEDVFAVQDDVTEKIVGALQVELLGDLRSSETQEPTDNSEAYDLVLRAREQYRFFTEQHNKVARELYERAIALDPSYGEPYAGLAETYVQDWFMGSEPNLDRAFETAQKAKLRSPNLPLVYEALSTVHLFNREHEKAIENARSWIKLEPGNADAYAALAGPLHFTGANHEAILLLERAMRLNPHYPFYYPHYMGMAHLGMRQFDRALAMLKRAVNRSPEAIWPHIYMAACHGHMGDAASAKQTCEQIRLLNADLSVSTLSKLLPYQNDADAAMLYDGLALAGLSE